MGVGTGAGRLRLSVMVGLTVLLVVLAGLRFARYDVAGTSFFAKDRYYTYDTDDGRHIENLNIDIVQYLSMVEDYRGVDGAFHKQEAYPEFAQNPDAVKGPVAPFIHRPALPFLASLLPFGSAESFAAINLLFLVAGLWCMVDALRVQGRSPLSQLLGGLLYAVALPVLVFGSSLFIDSGIVGVLTIGYWLLAHRRWRWFVAFLAVSYLFKEPIFLLAPVAAVAWRADGRRWSDSRFLIGAGLSVAGWVSGALLARSWAPEPVMSYSTMPKLSYFMGNISNVTSAVFFAVGLAPVVIPACIVAWQAVRRDGWRPVILGPSGADITGLALVALMNLYSIVSTDLTLRTGWLAFPFAIPLAVQWYESRVAQRAPAIA